MAAPLAEPPRDAAAPSPAAPATGRAGRVAFWLYAGHLYTLFGIALSNTLAGLTVLATGWLVARRGAERLAPQVALPRARRALLVALGLYVLALAVAIAASTDPGHSVRAFGELFVLVTLPLGLLLLRDERDVRRVVDGVVMVSALVALWGLAQYLGDYGQLDRRIRGPFSHWMTFAGFLLLADLLGVAALLFGPHRLGRGRAPGGRWGMAWRFLAVVAINAALVGSLTRSAWIAVAVALTLALGLRSPRALLALVPAAALFVLLAPVSVVGRLRSIGDLSDPSNYDRLCMTEAALEMVAERPLTGIGPDMAAVRYPIYRPPSAPRYDVPHLHDTFLQLAAERGLPGLAAYLAMTALALLAAWRLYRREGGRDGPRADLHLGVVLALVAFNLAGLFENNWGDTEVQRLAVFVLAVPFCLPPLLASQR